MPYLGCCILDAVSRMLSGMLYPGCYILDAVSGMLYLGCCILDADSGMLYLGCCIWDAPADLSPVSLAGHVPCGLICHPDREHILYPLGCTVVIQHLDTKKQSFLHGHANNVSCVVVPRDGMDVASGQVTCIGFKVENVVLPDPASYISCSAIPPFCFALQADIILWDFPKQELLAWLSLHEGKVEGLSFSPRGIYLVSLGGQDDGRVMVWDVSKREAVCGSPASPRSAGNANVVMCSSCRDEMFVTAGKICGSAHISRLTFKRVEGLHLPVHQGRLWMLLAALALMSARLCNFSTLLNMTDDDDDFYLGTTSGDVLKVNTSSKVVTACGPQKKKFSMHVHLAQSPWLKPPEGLNSRVLRAEGKVPNALETKHHQKYTSESTAKEAVRQGHEKDAVPFGGPKEKAKAQSQTTVQSVL
ncbi:hypothetical protein Q9233_014867 [Columba guinea]|nr:hypothetical protein Q9233_014867 [Columba guinea]